MRDRIVSDHDVERLNAAVQAVAETMWAGTPKGDRANRSISKLFS